jgi:RES domain-containing protein
MPEFASLDSYLHFQQSVRWKTRYAYDDETKDFLKTVIETSAPRVRRMKKGQILFRAQRGYRWSPEGGGAFEVETAFDPERMLPKAELVGEGRVNPSKIPCLYLATNRNTAMAEVRPWLGSRISLAEFKVMRDCLLVDCSLDKKRSRDFMLFKVNARKKRPEPDAATKETAVWGDIAHAFSEPVSADEPHSDYIATQILSETFRGHGYHGIVYKSLLDDRGRNVALFDVTSAELINCGLYQTRSVSFQFDQEDNPYFIAKHYPEPLEGKGGDDDEQEPPVTA